MLIFLTKNVVSENFSLVEKNEFKFQFVKSEFN